MLISAWPKYHLESSRVANWSRLGKDAPVWHVLDSLELT